MSKRDECQWNSCKKPVDIIYYDNGLCEHHWLKLCDMPLEKVFKKLNIKKDLDNKDKVEYNEIEEKVK